MRRFGYKFSAALIVLALAAFQLDSQAQNRRSESKAASSRQDKSVSRAPSRPSKPSANVSKPASRPAAKPSKPAVKPDSRPASKPQSPAMKPQQPQRPATKPSPQRPAVKPNPGPKPQRPAAKPPVKPSKPVYVKPQYRPGYRPIYRPAPRPRPVIVRPSYGAIIAANIAADMAWTAVNIAYFNTVARTYDQIDENYATINQQNQIIAQNNAVIVQQNKAIAENQQLAQEAFGLANKLGLVQNYADANVQYLYQDGVFYTQAANGEYVVIVPPAGALVESLPEDFETVILDGNEYYKVDNTIYSVAIVDGKAYFEVIGQDYR